MSAMAFQITCLPIVYSTVYSTRRSKKTSELRVTGLCDGNSPMTVEFPAQRASYTENVSIWWRHQGIANASRWHMLYGYFSWMGYISEFHVTASWIFILWHNVILCGVTHDDIPVGAYDLPSVAVKKCMSLGCEIVRNQWTDIFDSWNMAAVVMCVTPE